jgi:eukaryotic-like serine/threonine-protein kinase
VFDRARREHIWIKEISLRAGIDLLVVLHEFDTLRRLGATGSHVLRVRQLFVDEHAIAYSSELPPGASLGECLARLAPGHARLREVFTRLVLAIDAVHRSGIVHRDIQPANVFVTPEQRVVLFGFEIAVPTPEASARRHRAAGAPKYVAPEVYLGAPATGAADFYSVGTILYKALTGRLPFVGSTRGELLRRKFLEPMVPPSRVRRGVPADLDELCVALLDMNPARRPGAEAIVRALGASARRGAS